MTRFLPILVLFIACSKEDPDTGDTGLGGLDQLPELQITAPERASFHPPGALRVQGQTQVHDAALKSLIINGIDIQVESTGEFSQILPVSVGLNLLGAHLEDLAGRSAKDGRAFYWGTALYPGDRVKEGLRLRLGPELLDDNDPDLDDVATLIEIAAADDSLAKELEGIAVVDDNYDFILTSLDIGSADVDIDPQNGFLSVGVDLHDFTMDFDINDIFGIGSLDTNGSAWASTVRLTLDLALTLNGGQIESSATQAETSLSGFGLTIDNFPDSLEEYLADWIQDYIQEAATEALKEQASGLLVNFIEGMSADINIGEIAVFTTLNQVEIKPTGIRITADLASEGADLSHLPKNAGSPKTPSEPPNWAELPDQPLAVAIDDDLLNQFFFSYWATGAMEGFEFSGTELALLAGGPIDAPIGPVSSASLGFMLPPMFRKSNQKEMTGDMGFGELRLAISREDGLVQDFSINAWVGTQATLADSGKINFKLESRPEFIPMEIGVLQSDPTLDPVVLADLIEGMMPSLFERASALAPSFEIPAIPLGETLNVSALSDLELRLEDASVALNDDNWLLLGAAVGASESSD
jgi:hypothetical protein